MPLRWFSAQKFPPMTRPSYRRELTASVTLPVAEALIESNVIGVVAKRIFEVTDFQLAILVAAPMYANLTSFLWARWSHGRGKIGFAGAVSGLVLGAVAAIGLLPVGQDGAWPLVAAVVIARCGLAGLITIRSTVWRHNYPRHVRGRITSRLVMAGYVMMLVAPLIASAILEAEQDLIHGIYPLGAAIGLIGLFSFLKIRMRGQRALMRFETSAEPEGQAVADPHGAWSVLKKDAPFRTYMIWMFFGGFANMMLIPVVIKLIADRTEGLAGDLIIATVITQTLPALATVSSMPLWARLLDGIHVARFRVRQGSLWLVSFALMGAGAAWTGSLLVGLGLFAVGRVVLGLCYGGGKLAWQLGHHDFAKRENASAYMGAHVTLTGIRGAIAPFVGMLLLEQIGAGVFGVSMGLAAIAVIGFWRLGRQTLLPAD